MIDRLASIGAGAYLAVEEFAERHPSFTFCAMFLAAIAIVGSLENIPSTAVCK